jgi:hypothetical protein
MVVYSILTTESDTQYVRLYSTYNPPSNDAMKNPDEISVTDAVVKVTGTNPLYDGRIIDFQSFDLKRPDQGRYASDIGAYYAFPFRPIWGATYRLTAVSPTYGNATADLALPTRGLITFVNPFVLENPWNYPVDLTLSIKLSSQVKAFLVRLYIEYDLFHPETRVWIPHRVEVPFKVNVISKTMELFEYTYPSMTPRQTPENSSNLSNVRDSYTFLVSAYQNVVYQIVSHADSSRFKQAVCYLIQFDEQLYRYYEEANRFNDKNSIRLDQPDYTNIQGGIGLFASMGIDSVQYPLPKTICPPRSPTVICH